MRPAGLLFMPGSIGLHYNWYHARENILLTTPLLSSSPLKTTKKCIPLAFFTANECLRTCNTKRKQLSMNSATPDRFIAQKMASGCFNWYLIWRDVQADLAPYFKFHAFFLLESSFVPKIVRIIGCNPAVKYPQLVLIPTLHCCGKRFNCSLSLNKPLHTCRHVIPIKSNVQWWNDGNLGRVNRLACIVSREVCSNTLFVDICK